MKSKKYLPFINGLYSVAPGLFPLAKTEGVPESLVFHIDDHYENYIANKKECRDEDIRKYYPHPHFGDAVYHTVVNYIVSQMVTEHPGIFEFEVLNSVARLRNSLTGEVIQWHISDLKLADSSVYVDLFDALCSQLQEDFAVCQLTKNDNLMAAIHLCAPNHWAASDKTGRPFQEVHAPVPGMEKQMPHVQKMLQSVVAKGPFYRFAWGISTDDRLNHHPVPFPEADPAFWRGRQISEDAPLFIRTEKQNLIGFPAVNAFLFTIRTYFYNVEELAADEKQKLWLAVKSMMDASLEYKGLHGKMEILKKKILG